MEVTFTVIYRNVQLIKLQKKNHKASLGMENRNLISQ